MISKINAATASTSAIKSTQTVMFSPSTSGAGPNTMSVTISSVNPAKCAFLVNGGLANYDGSNMANNQIAPYYYVSSTSTSVTIGWHAPFGSVITWSKGTVQVIEYV